MASVTPSEFFNSLRVFAGPEHLPFRWEAGEPAAVLVHGFPGTPADFRPLAASLHAGGWTVDGPLLPGFGPALGTLPEKKYAEWVDAVARRIAALKRHHSPVIAVGHSLGGAVSLLATMKEYVDGQVLLAPYWRFGHAVQHLLWPAVRPLARRWRPLRRADFTDEGVRRTMSRILPDVDLDDHRARSELRQLVVPLSLLDELWRAGKATYTAARHTRIRTLVVQGLRDRIVLPATTKKLFSRLSNPAGIELVDGAHGVLQPDDPGWGGTESAVLAFAASMLPTCPVPTHAAATP